MSRPKSVLYSKVNESDYLELKKIHYSLFSDHSKKEYCGFVLFVFSSQFDMIFGEENKAIRKWIQDNLEENIHYSMNILASTIWIKVIFFKYEKDQIRFCLEWL